MTCNLFESSTLITWLGFAFYILQQVERKIVEKHCAITFHKEYIL
jgi:hypothetical protein